MWSMVLNDRVLDWAVLMFAIEYVSQFSWKYIFISFFIYFIFLFLFSCCVIFRWIAALDSANRYVGIKKHILVTCVQVHDLSTTVLYGKASSHDHCHDFDAFSPFRPKLCVDSIIRIKHGWWKLSAWSGLQRRSILLHISCSRTNLPWHTLGPWTLRYILFMSRHGCMYLRVRVRITII
jgi:hypothetical protein